MRVPAGRTGRENLNKTPEPLSTPDWAELCDFAGKFPSLEGCGKGSTDDFFDLTLQEFIELFPGGDGKAMPAQLFPRYLARSGKERETVATDDQIPIFSISSKTAQAERSAVER